MHGQMCNVMIWHADWFHCYALVEWSPAYLPPKTPQNSRGMCYTKPRRRLFRLNAKSITADKTQRHLHQLLPLRVQGGLLTFCNGQSCGMGSKIFWIETVIAQCAEPDNTNRSSMPAAHVLLRTETVFAQSAEPDNTSRNSQLATNVLLNRDSPCTVCRARQH